MSHQATRLIECERAAIGNEIHDSLLPLLFASSASLSSLTDRLSDQSGEIDFEAKRQIVDRISQANQWIEQALKIGREILSVSYPPELNATAWYSAAQDLVDRIATETDGGGTVNIIWNIQPEASRLSESIAATAYRICVESLRNALKHGDATEVSVDARVVDGSFNLVVHDNGKGFDPSQSSSRALWLSFNERPRKPCRWQFTSGIRAGEINSDPFPLQRRVS